MRSSLLSLVLALGLVLAPQVLAQARSPAQPPLPAGVPAAPAGAAAPTPGVVTLSDVARQAPSAAPAVADPLPAAPAGAEGRLAEQGLLRAAPPLPALRPALSIMLARISSVGADTSAVLWVKGRHRKVAPGARVLQYTVGEIRDEGVCLYQPRRDGKSGDRCQELVTFVQGV